MFQKNFTHAPKVTPNYHLSLMLFDAEKTYSHAQQNMHCLLLPCHSSTEHTVLCCHVFISNIRSQLSAGARWMKIQFNSEADASWDVWHWYPKRLQEKASHYSHLGENEGREWVDKRKEKVNKNTFLEKLWAKSTKN